MPQEDTVLTFAKGIRRSADRYFANESIYKMVEQITKEFTRKSFGYDFRDLKQTLWLKVYELDDWNNEEYLAKCLRNAGSDFFRKEIKYRKNCTLLGSFDGYTEEQVIAITPKLAGEHLKSALIMYSLYPQDIPIDIRDYIQIIWNDLNKNDRLSIYAYAHSKHNATDRKRMQRILSKYSEVDV